MQKVILISTLLSFGCFGSAIADSKDTRAKLIFSAMGISNPSQAEIKSVANAMRVKLEYDVSRIIKQKRDTAEFKTLLNARNEAEENLNAALEASQVLWARHEKARNELRDKLGTMASDEKDKAVKELSESFRKQREIKDAEVRKAQAAFEEAQLAFDSFVTTAPPTK